MRFLLDQDVHARTARFLRDFGHEMPHPLGKKEFSGKFVLRVEPAIHRRLAAKALAAGESLNSYCVKTLCKV